MKATDERAVHRIHDQLMRFAVPIESIKPWPGNYRKHDIPRLRASLRKFGQTARGLALVQQSTMQIYAGNGIHRAAIEEGWTHIAAVVVDVDDVTAEQYLVADNHLHDVGDDDAEALSRFLAGLHAKGGLDTVIGYSQRQLDAFLANLTSGSGDVPVEPIKDADVWVKPGDMFALGPHRLLCGDALDERSIARLFGTEDVRSRADAVFTSPPYAVGVDYGPEYDDTIANLRATIAAAAALWNEVVVPGGFAVVNFGDVAKGRDVVGGDEVTEYPMALEYWPAFREAGWSLWARRVWVKPNARVNAPWTASTNRAATDFEHVWTWKRTGEPIVGRVDGRYASPNGWFDSTSEEGVDIGKDEHGAGMALVTALRMVAIHSRRGNIVHEPFMGTGTTLVACDRLERRCYGTELSPRYVQMTLARWERATGGKAKKL